MVAYQPDRGDFIVVDCSPQAGTEQAGRRPALVLSPQSFNVALGLVFACPITSKVSGSAFDVPVPASCRVKGAVLLAHLSSFDWIARNVAFHSRAPDSFVEDIVARLNAVIETNESQAARLAAAGRR